MRRLVGPALPLLALLAFGLPAAAQEVVRLGAYHFPPYAVNTADGMGGLVVGLVAAMNAAQDEVVFEIVPTSAVGRHADFESGAFDAIAFEDLAWGWEDRPVEASGVFMEGAEVYVARAGVGAAFFEDVGHRSIAAVYGFHYAFAGFDGDPASLHRRFDIELPLDPLAALYHVLEGRVEIAVVPDLFLRQAERTYAEFAGSFTVGDRPDQIYHHRILVRRGGPVSADTVDRILDRLRSSGALLALVEPWVE